MRLNLVSSSFILTILLWGNQRQSFCSDSIVNRKLILKAHQLIKEYYSGTKQANNVVKVVYFHARDQKPLANWSERLTWTLKDVSKYYKEEFCKYGIEIEGIPFEKCDENIVFYLVEGDSKSRNYGIKNGQKIQNEIYQKTKGQIDFSKDHVLVINGLCDRRKDGLYVFHSPYHGTGSSINGVCQVADCELLDVRLLRDTAQRIKFSEMAVAQKECSVAEFNSWYIGGIAHEMGHMFGLPHDYGHPNEFTSSGISLMGQYGSRHYREYLWEGKTSSYFSVASILQLISHPIFIHTIKSNNIDLNISLLDIKIEKKPNGTALKINMGSGTRPYGTVALVRQSSESEYFNRSFYNVVSDKDTISLELSQLSKGTYNFQLLLLFPNGAVRWYNKQVSVDNNENVTILDISTNDRVDIKKFYEKLQKMEKTREVETKLEILSGILNPSEPIDPKTYDGSRLILSDAKWEQASVGWESVARNYFSCEAEFKFFLEFQGQLYEKGLYAHSPSSYVFYLDKKWKKFSAVVGLRDYAHTEGSAKFTLIGDGKILYESPALRTNQKDLIKVDISNIKILELQANGTEGHNHNSWAIWLNPVIER